MKNLLLLIGLSAWVAQGASAQSFCASDGQTPPLTLVERFISANCEACWSATQTPEAAGALTLDWIVPTAQGDEAPLSAASNRDALMRLETLGLAAPLTLTVTSAQVTPGFDYPLRVAQGAPVGDYIGASIELQTTLTPLHPETLSVWLVLVETIPAGTEGTPTKRNLVRNVLLSTWHRGERLPGEEPNSLREIRPLNIPQGAKSERLRVLGWVQDARGRVLGAAQSVCAAK